MAFAGKPYYVQGLGAQGYVEGPFGGKQHTHLGRCSFAINLQAVQIDFNLIKSLKY